jgi:hypothetical protein
MVFSVFLCRKVAALTILAYSPVDSPVYTQDSRTVLDLHTALFTSPSADTSRSLARNLVDQ